MSNSMTTPRFEDVEFRACIRVHENSVFLGHATVTLVVPDAIEVDDDEYEDLRLTFYGLQVKLLGDELRSRFDFAQVKGRGNRSGEYFPTAIPRSAKTRELLTESLFSDALIAATAAITREQVLAGATKVA
ncbi:MAG: hypothetical protein V3S69_04855 [Dehalococcoidales bacterium]